MACMLLVNIRPVLLQMVKSLTLKLDQKICFDGMLTKRSLSQVSAEAKSTSHSCVLYFLLKCWMTLQQPYHLDSIQVGPLMLPCYFFISSLNTF